MASLKDRIYFVGIGQCGGNIAKEASKKGFKTGAINTSKEDLENDDMNLIPNKLLIGTLGGCGKERKLGQNIVKKEYQKIVDFIGEKFLYNIEDISSKGQKVILYLCFSSSGGTGSGVGPILISILKKVYPEVCFGAIVVAPSNDESLIALNNSLKCLEELSKINIPLFILDNDNGNKDGISRKALYDLVNRDIVSSIDKFVSINNNVAISSMDEKDKSKLLMTPGIMLINTTPLMESEMKTNTSLAKAIETSWTNNIYSKINFDKVIKRIGFIFEIPENVSSKIDYNLILSNIGNPTEVFEGIYPTDNIKGKVINRITSILTGLSFTESKIKSLVEILDEKGKDVNFSNKPKDDLFGTKDNKKSFDSLFEDNDENDLFSDFESSDDSEDGVDIESILNQY